MLTATVQVTAAKQIRETAQRAGQVLSSGGLVVFPTETVYGIAAAADSDKGFAALRTFKGRSESQPFTIHLPDPAAAELYVDTGIPQVGRLIRKVFPGPVTLVVDVSESVIESRLKQAGFAPHMRDRLYFRNTVGLRCPDHDVAQALLGSVAGPVLASSANRRGQPSPFDAEEAAEAVQGAAQLIVDGGRCRYAKWSTIVHLREESVGHKVTVDRVGVYDERFMAKLLRWTMLLVCSGNTCRSPMAEGIAKQMLAKRRRIGLDELEAVGLKVVSAGASAVAGMPASTEAVEAMNKLGFDLSKHGSRVLTPELIHEADVIFCMTCAHCKAVIEMVPSASDKTFQLDSSGDIDDPMGSGPTAYQRCAELISRRLERRLKEQAI